MFNQRNFVSAIAYRFHGWQRFEFETFSAKNFSIKITVLGICKEKINKCPVGALFELANKR
jgi:hypothetical protein